MKKLTVSVDINGKVSFLDSFPNDEEHYGLHDMLKECHGEIEVDLTKDKPGLYLATMGIEQSTADWTGEYEAYLDIRELEPLRLIPQEPTWQEREEAEQLKASFLEYRKKRAALDPTITLGDEWDSKDVYLTMTLPDGEKQIIGLHAIGHAQEYTYTEIGRDNSRTEVTTGFAAIETWGNSYDENHNMLGRGSFRLHSHDLDKMVKECESEGWVRCERPGGKFEDKEKDINEEGTEEVAQKVEENQGK